MEMQCELLISNFKDSKTIALVKENIGHISDGSSSHCGGALKLGLKKAFELKKKKRQPPGVKLRCVHWSGCVWHNKDIPYSSVGSRLHCPNLSCGYTMQCAGCGYQRDGIYASCQSCGGMFV